MTRQWIRKCVLSVDGESGSVDLSSLRIRFKVEQNNVQRPNAARVTITNVARSTFEKIKKEGKKITIEAGYEEGFGRIFQGQIIQAIYGRENPTDTYVTIVAQSGDHAYNFSVVNKTLAAGHTFRDQVDAVLDVMKPFGITAGHISDLGNKKMPRARTLHGMARDVLRQIGFSTASDWSIQDDKLQILKSTDTVPGQAFILNTQTGLIGMPTQTIDGILVRCLLNPRIRPGTRIKIDQKSVQQAVFSPNYTGEVMNSMLPSLAADGFYKVVIAEHEGDTRGTPWYTDINCIRADGQGPIPLSYASQGVTIPE